ncbi:MAG: coenzyme F420-0:L-glutamate ligase [candidate division WOR-3 bacterium]|nr:coenzyme F420-0:L-glutamate ligase [candidate division WOR-3 bacterium]MCX7757804.1 coenzyme F420-0:L-glutamate ligase [candidate division WOR-3 bacterium]MDW7987201.1 coenzyme F420-0:L-glutamate ligase [candidate division WOR-3 bacterium]
MNTSTKPEYVVYKNKLLRRILVKTHIITEKDSILEIINQYVAPLLLPNDIVTISESVVAITQGRAIKVSKIRPRILAKLLWRFVRKVPYGIGLRNPYSMECAFRECGTTRILVAAFISAFAKLVRRKGDFYRICGIQAAMIDAPGTAGLAQFRDCVILGPQKPHLVVSNLALKFQTPFAIVDANDIFGCTVVACSHPCYNDLISYVLDDNPMGQGAECTPIAIIRGY